LVDHVFVDPRLAEWALDGEREVRTRYHANLLYPIDEQTQTNGVLLTLPFGMEDGFVSL